MWYDIPFSDLVLNTLHKMHARVNSDIIALLDAWCSQVPRLAPSLIVSSLSMDFVSILVWYNLKP